MSPLITYDDATHIEFPKAALSRCGGSSRRCWQLPSPGEYRLRWAGAMNAGLFA
jgi:hypothetical protein